MEKKINVAELLKNCPEGMELDCTIYEGAKLGCVTNDKKYPIKIIIKDDIDGDIQISLTEEGYYNMYHNPKCVIFPKGKTTWEGFVSPCKFKVGDKIRHKSYTREVNIVTEIKDTHYILNDEFALPFICQDEHELVPNKFDINTLKPFDKVLVRDFHEEYWIINFFGFHDKNTGKFHCLGNCEIEIGWNECVPYEGNEHLLSKTDSCNEYYKTWE